MLHRAVNRSLRKCCLVICIEDTTPFPPSTEAEQGSDSLRMGVTIAHSELFRGHERVESKNLLLGLARPPTSIRRP